MKNYLVILHSKEIDSNVFIRVKSHERDALMKALKQLYTPLYVEFLKTSTEFTCFEDYMSQCLNSDNLYHIVTMTDTGALVDVNYYQV